MTNACQLVMYRLFKKETMTKMHVKEIETFEKKENSKMRRVSFDKMTKIFSIHFRFRLLLLPLQSPCQVDGEILSLAIMETT